jgi:hypothetical protein
MIHTSANAKEHRQQIQEPVSGIEQAIEIVDQGELFDFTKADGATSSITQSLHTSVDSSSACTASFASTAQKRTSQWPKPCSILAETSPPTCRAYNCLSLP